MNERTDGQINKRTKVPLCSTGHLPFRGRCPKTKNMVFVKRPIYGRREGAMIFEIKKIRLETDKEFSVGHSYEYKFRILHCLSKIFSLQMSLCNTP